MDDQGDNNESEEEKDNVAAFPGKRERKRRLLIMRAANDGGHVEEPAINLPPVVKALCFALIFSHLALLLMPFIIGDERALALMYTLAFVPARYTGGVEAGLGAVISPLTHMFVHAGWLHLVVNVLTLMAFGAGLEKWIGGRRMLVICFLSGVIGALAQLALTPDLKGPLVGASGAISGLFGALLVEMQARGHLSQGNGRMSLLVFAGIWVATSLFFSHFGVPGEDAQISWATHVGGFIAGMALGWFGPRPRRLS